MTKKDEEVVMNKIILGLSHFFHETKIIVFGKIFDKYEKIKVVKI